MIELDGNYGEGGGALVRTALALATLTGQEFKVTNIRAGRDEPGLKAQHLTAIHALQQLGNAVTNKVEIGSTELYFRPGKIQKGVFEFDIGTAGSIALLLQSLTLPALFAPGKVTFKLKGGTCGKWQASVDYIQNILFPQLLRFVEKIELKILKRGYYPQGGGEAVVEITPRFKVDEFASVPALLEEMKYKTVKISLCKQGKLEQIKGIVNVSLELQEKEVGERIKKAAENVLKDYKAPLNIRVEYTKARSIGGEILLWGVFSNERRVDYDNPVLLGGDALIEKGKSSEEIGREAAQELEKEIEAEAAVDAHLMDQLILYMGLLPGSSIQGNKVNDHTLTNIYVVEKFLSVGFKMENNVISVEEKIN